jgi:hypothetical protein
MSANIFAANPVEEAGVVHDEKGLSMRSAEDEVFAALAKFVMEIFQGVEAGGVHGEHFSHAENQHLRILAGALERGFEFVDSAEKERAKDAEDEDAIGNFFADKRVVGALGFGGLIDRGDLRCFGDAFDEEDGSEDHPDFDGKS